MSRDYPVQVSSAESKILLDLLHGVLTAGDYGHVVEFGCYKGDTSLMFQRAIRAVDPSRELWLYDSFAGLPEKSALDASAAGDAFRAGELLATKREVIEKFKKAGLKVPRIKKAFFKDLDLAQDLPDRVAFAFLDGDLYDSIKQSLHLVLPHLAKNGVIVVHDYNNPSLPGVTRAVDEWLRANPRYRLDVQESLAILR